MTQLFDSGDMEFSGEAQPIRSAERIESFSISQNNILAYRVGNESSAGLAVADRTGGLIDIVDGVNGVNQFSLSPDATRIAFSGLETFFSPSYLAESFLVSHPTPPMTAFRCGRPTAGASPSFQTEGRPAESI